MTTFSEVEMTCGVCTTTSPQSVLISTSTFGAPDLDTRPAELQRSTIWLWVKRCPSCGFCAADLAEAPPVATDVRRGEPYRAQLSDPDYSELANDFLCAALVQEEAGELAEAGWSALAAAWVCDDDGRDSSARSARSRAAELFRAARTAGQPFADSRAAEHAILADVLRRASLREEALREAQAGLASNPDGVVRVVLEFERDLIEQFDTAAHTVDECEALA